MRTENEMYQLIMKVANEDPRIRVVYMNGSRANPHVKKDIYQDFDIVFMVTETESFLENRDWLKAFGELAIKQEPERNNPHVYYCWIMLFKDGNRIDLNIRTKDYALEKYTEDSLCVPILDKDHCLPEIPATNDSSYYIKLPEERLYRRCCNEFWWCMQNVAKGIARDQLPYAMWMYHCIIREELNNMLSWYIDVNSDHSLNVGMSGKYFKKLLPARLYELYTKTFSGSDFKEVWASVFTACDLFGEIAPKVGAKLGFEYVLEEEKNMLEYMNWVKSTIN